MTVKNWRLVTQGHNPNDRAVPSDKNGFTIVETLFVLAIAGIILLIVLQAVPALERNSRNNQRKQDVQTILEAVSHWELNHSGNIPSASDNFLQYSNLTYYDRLTGVTIHPDSPGNPLSKPPSNNQDVVSIYNYQKCSTSTPSGSSTAQGAGYSDIVALYAIESSGGPEGQCQQL